MPFHKYNSAAAKKLFKSSAAPSVLSAQSPSRVTKPNSIDRKPSPLAQTIKENLERARERLNEVKKERYDSDLALSRLGEQAAYRAKLEEAQRAALDDQLREDALEALREEQRPGIIEDLTQKLEPEVRAELYKKLKTEIRPKVHIELRSELSGEVWEELKVDLLEDVKIELKNELQEELETQVREQLQETLYSEVIAQLKEENRDRILLQLKDELASELAQQVNGVNGYHEDVLDPALRAESEASDTVHPAAERATHAKRRYSDTFEQEDAEERSKKLRMSEPPSQRTTPKKSAFQPVNVWPFTSVVEDNKPVDESLDEGVAADVEENGKDDTAGVDGDYVVEEVDHVAILEDVYAEADNEMSEAEPQHREQPAPLDIDLVAGFKQEEVEPEFLTAPTEHVEVEDVLGRKVLKNEVFEGFGGDAASVAVDILNDPESLQHKLEVEGYLNTQQTLLRREKLNGPNDDELYSEKPLPAPYFESSQPVKHDESSSLSEAGATDSEDYYVEQDGHKSSEHFPAGETDEDERSGEVGQEYDEEPVDFTQQRPYDTEFNEDGEESNDFEDYDGDEAAEGDEGDEDDQQIDEMLEDEEYEQDATESATESFIQQVNPNSRYSQMGGANTPIDLDSD